MQIRLLLFKSKHFPGGFKIWSIKSNFSNLKQERCPFLNDLMKIKGLFMKKKEIYFNP